MLKERFKVIIFCISLFMLGYGTAGISETTIVGSIFLMIVGILLLFSLWIGVKNE